jgi:glycosidase
VCTLYNLARIIIVLKCIYVQECSVHGMSAWTWSEKRGQFYLHNFLDFVPDLNLRNPAVVLDMKV